MTWFKADENKPDEGEFWWAVEHNGHPAFYLRALLAGDFAPGRKPSQRHVCGLDGEFPVESVVCGTCGKIPKSEDLEVFERRTGKSGFLNGFRRGKARWPNGTESWSCWLCSSQHEQPHEVETLIDIDEPAEDADDETKAEHQRKLARIRIKVCWSCAEFLRVKKAKKAKRPKLKDIV
jgi:hypothetical protein